MNNEIFREVNATLQKIHAGQWELYIFTKGNTNTICLASYYKHEYPSTVFVTHRSKGEYTYIVRVFKSDGIIDRAKELVSWEYLSKNNLAPRIISEFKNGMVVDYVDGVELEDSEMKIYRYKIAKKMREWHDTEEKGITSDANMRDKMDTPQANLYITNNNVLPAEAYQSFFEDNTFEATERKGCDLPVKQNVKRASMLFPTIRKWFESAKERNMQLYNKLNLELYLCQVELYFKQRNCKIGFCHNDLLSSNILKREDDSIYFIDYEYSGYNYAAFDIANHFCEYAGYQLDYKLIPNKQEMLVFLKAYDVEKGHLMLEEIIDFMPICHLFWGVWSLLREGSFNYYGYGVARLYKFVELVNSSWHLYKLRPLESTSSL